MSLKTLPGGDDGPSTLKVVFLDAVGTLIYLPEPVGEHYRAVALRHGADIPALAMEKEFRRCWKLAPARQNVRGPRPDDDKGWWRELVNQVLDGTLPAEVRDRLDHEAFFEELYAHFARPGVWAVYPEVQSVLRSLKSRQLVLGIISNFDRRLYSILDQLALTPFFETIVISSEIGADKPHPEIFEQALALLNVRPSETVHVGDDHIRDRGASAVGIEVFELDRPQRTLGGLPAWLSQHRSGQNALATGHNLS